MKHSFGIWSVGKEHKNSEPDQSKKGQQPPLYTVAIIKYMESACMPNLTRLETSVKK